MQGATRRSPRIGRRWLLTSAGAASVALIAIVLTTFPGGNEATSATRSFATGVSSASPTEAPRTSSRSEPIAAAPLTRSVPQHVRIPAIGVDSELIALGLMSDGTLQTPPSAFPAGWFTGAPTPGELGPAVIAGHVRYEEPGVFARLSDVRSGDAIYIDRTDGDIATFRVTRVATFEKSSFPTQEVYGNISFAGLRLITCGGFNGSTEEFDDNIVVFAELVSPQ